jgi:hypothetical protein
MSSRHWGSWEYRAFVQRLSVANTIAMKIDSGVVGASERDFDELKRFWCVVILKNEKCGKWLEARADQRTTRRQSTKLAAEY